LRGDLSIESAASRVSFALFTRNARGRVIPAEDVGEMRRGGANYPKTVNEDNWPRLFRQLSDQCGFSADQVDQLLFTQISKSSIEVAAKRCNVPVEKCHMIMQKYGYTGSACIPMAFDDAIELGKIKRGDLVVMIQSGLGWNQAAAAIRMTL
jgi:3-oxoacyl-[acyl-carrier-protein] synthase III